MIWHIVETSVWGDVTLNRSCEASEMSQELQVNKALRRINSLTNDWGYRITSRTIDGGITWVLTRGESARYYIEILPGIDSNLRPASRITTREVK